MKRFIFVFILSLVAYCANAQPYNFIQKTVDANREAYDIMGTSVVVRGDFAAVGEPNDKQDLNELLPIDSAGSVHIYRRNPDASWSHFQKITPSDRGMGDKFGFSIAMEGNQLFVGAYGQMLDENSANPLPVSGAVYVYEYISGVWTFRQKIVAYDRDGGELFGLTMAVDNGVLIIGAPDEEKDENGIVGALSGAVYVYQKDNTGNWNFVQKIVGFDKDNGDYYGSSISKFGNVLAVGSFKNDIGGAAVHGGAVYIYEKIAGSWVFKNKVTASNIAPSDLFGYSVSVDGNFIVVGANRKDAGIQRLGRVYVFKKDGSGNWVQIQTMSSPTGSATLGAFGSVVKSINGKLFIGSPIETIGSFPPVYGFGAVFIYNRDGLGVYQYSNELTAPNINQAGFFGFSLDVDNSKLFVGAIGEALDENDQPPALDSAGAFYIFEQCVQSSIPSITSVSGNLSICQGDSVQLVISTADTLNSAREWFWYTGGYPGGTLVDSTDTVWVKPNTTTTYSVVGEGYCVTPGTSDSVGTITVNILPSPNLNINASPNDTVCLGQSVILTASGASTYVWDNGVSNGVSFMPSATNTYKVVGTSSSGCKDSTTIQIVVNPVPTVGINYTGSTTICSGTLITLSGTGAVSYMWDNGVTDGVAFAPNATATYTVTGVNAQGCSDTQSMTINVVPGPTVTASAGLTTICEGTPVTLSATGADTYVWNNGLGAGATHTVTPSVTTEYIVTGTQTATGCTDADTVTITVNPLPNVVANASPNDSICLGDNLTLTGSGATTYTWNNGVVDGVTFTPTLGAVDYIVTGTDVNSCVNKDTITILVTQPPTVGVNASATTICSGQDVILSGTGAATYVWDNGVIDGQPFQPTATATYTVIGTDAYGCTGTAVQQVTVNPSPLVSAISSAGGASLCEGDTLTLTATGNAQTYIWDNGIIDGQPFVPTVGTHLYKVTAISANLCQDSAFVSVVVNPQDDATITPVGSICGNVPAFNLQAVTPNGVWQGVGIVNSSTGEFDPMTAGEGVHEIIYTTTGTCSDADTINIEVYPALIVNVYGDSVCYGDADGEVSVEVIQGVTPYTYLWETGDVTPVLSDLEEGTYLVEVRDSNNCIVNDTAEVIMTENCNYHLFIPNVFSPNGDGLNDVLYVRGKGFKKFSFVVFDRWGNKMFESSDKEIGWDGKFRGKLVDSGVFVYHVKIEYFDGTKVVKDGNVGVVY